MRKILLILVLISGCRAEESRPAAPALPAVAAQPSSTRSAAELDAETPSLSSATHWDFESDAVGSAPAGFLFGRTGEGRAGKWVVLPQGSVPGGKNVLAQTDADPTDYRFPVAFASQPTLKDVDLRVRCSPISGAVDRACGLIFRLKDVDNYYLTRANALENNVRFYFVKGGRRQEVASWSGKVTSGAWHDYRVTMTGDHVQVFWDGAKVLDQHDATFGDAGKLGVWTKADSVTYFDDLSVSPPS